MGYSYAAGEAIAALISTAVSAVSSSAIGILIYVFTALSLYTIASRRQIRSPWLSWIPVANLWILGSISDQYRYVARGEIHSKRKLLLALGIANVLLNLVQLVKLVPVVVHLAGFLLSGTQDQQLLWELMELLSRLSWLVLPTVAVSAALLVIRHMALYDLYSSCMPGRQVLFLVLGIFFQLAQAICLFLCRNQEAGMPPRRYSQYTQ